MAAEDDAPTQPVHADEAALTTATLDFPVVGIGASAGGVTALLRFFENMPADNGMAFVVILHLSPKHASNLHDLLQQVTKMPVQQVNEQVDLQPNHVYVIPPNKHLTMNDGYLRVSDFDRTRGQRHVAIDLFFRSLAVVHRHRAVAIVLSGTGSDGAVGIKRIKEQGGVTLVQSPADAEFDGMPRAALDTDMIDWALPVVEMPQKLVELWTNARRIELPKLPDERVPADPPPSDEAMRRAEEALREIMQTLRARTGHDFRHYKRATVLRRLERRLQVNALPDLWSYRKHLQSEPSEAQALLRDLLIGVTNFFRDHEAYDALEREVVPQLFGPPASPPDAVRAWVPACATGEEAYSLAMLLQEQALRMVTPPQVQVFASDIDERAIAVARAGLYPDSIVADVSPPRLRVFFTRDEDRYRVRKELREKILFAPHNVLRDPPFSKLDLISCRNLLIYLDRHVHAEILEMFHFALRPGGFLFLGSSETAEATPRLFAPVDKKHRIYRASKTERASHYLPPLQAASKMPTLAAPAEAQGERRRVGYAELHRRLAEQHAPPSVLIDTEANIVHLSGEAGRYLRYTDGPPSHHLPSLVLPELRLELRTAVFQAQQSSKSVEARRVQVERDGKRRYVNMIVRPVQDEQIEQPLLLVLFDEVEDTMVGDTRAPGGEQLDPVIAHLEDELARTKERLQLTIEHAETSTEELKASNEELQAINEELRSTTEELETSKEELQSINEELITVNQELKMKVEETGKVNDDLQNIIASTDIATVFVDRGLSIKRYTPAATQIFNIIPTDVGRPLLDITHRLDYDRLLDDIADTLQTLRLHEREVASSDGRWYLARLLPYRTVEDRIDGAVIAFVDITARVQAEAQARASEERMRLLAASMRDYAIMTLDLDGKVTTWNSGAERLFGWQRDEIVGQPAAVLFVPEDRERGVADEEMRRARTEGRAMDDRWHARKDGSRFFASGIMTPLYRDGGELEGYGKIARDLTGTRLEEVQREAALTRMSSDRAEARALAEQRDEFLAVMSHELKNPLNLIQLNAELLAKLPEARGLRGVERVAGIIKRSVLTQAKIIDDLLDLSRINTGKLALHPAAVDLATALGGIVGALREEAERKSIRLDVQWPEPPVAVHADPVRVEQIAWNLLNNAVKFTPEGGHVNLRVFADEAFGVIEVRDTGRGIAPRFLPMVFDMYRQADWKSRSAGGLGIGLALVRHLAQLHGGRVAVRSEGEGKGSTFTVWLPREEAVQGAEAPPQPPELTLRGLSVLVVDDEADSVATLQELLAFEGLEVTTAGGAAEALQTLANRGFDLIISDIAMPGMDGYEFVAALRAKPEWAAMRTIALTGYGRAADAKRALDAGFNAHLSKPVTLQRLVATLVEVLQLPS